LEGTGIGEIKKDFLHWWTIQGTTWHRSTATELEIATTSCKYGVEQRVHDLDLYKTKVLACLKHVALTKDEGLLLVLYAIQRNSEKWA
jgi:hypothetical protein